MGSTWVRRGVRWRKHGLRATARVRSGVLASNLEKNAQNAQSLRLPCGNMNCRAAPSMKEQRQDTQDTEKARKEGTKKSSLRTSASSGVMSSARYAMGPAGCESLPWSMFAHVSPLEYALTKNAPVSPLECALTKTKDLKSHEMNTYRKTRVGAPPFLHAGQDRASR